MTNSEQHHGGCLQRRVGDPFDSRLGRALTCSTGSVADTYLATRFAAEDVMAEIIAVALRVTTFYDSTLSFPCRMHLITIPTYFARPGKPEDDTEAHSFAGILK